MSVSIRTMVVGVATVGELDPVLPCAIEIAGDRGAELHVVHVSHLPEYLAHALPRLSGALGIDPGHPERYASRVEERMKEQVARFSSGARIACHALLGSPHEKLAEFAESAGADLLVVGATRRGRILRDVLGATAERVLGETSVPTLVFHEPLFHGVRRVLFATDVSELGAGILERALDTVEAVFGGGELELRAVFVAETELLPGLPLESRVLEEAARQELERFMAGLDTRGREVAAAVRVGEPAWEIGREAREWEADLLVVGTHARCVPPGMRFGSVAAATVRDAGRNVLVVPAAPRPRPHPRQAVESVLATA